MLSGVVLTLVVLGIVVVLLGLFCRAWLGSQGFIAERVRIELTQREAEAQAAHRPPTDPSSSPAKPAIPDANSSYSAAGGHGEPR